MKHDEFLQVLRSPFHFATCDAVLRGCKIVDISKPLQWRRLSKKVRSPLGPLCEGAPPPLWRKRHLPRIGGGGSLSRRGRLFDSLSRCSGRTYKDRGCRV